MYMFGFQKIKFEVRNSNDGLMGGYVSREAAEDARARFEKEYKNNPWNPGLKFYVVEL